MLNVSTIGFAETIDNTNVNEQKVRDIYDNKIIYLEYNFWGNKFKLGEKGKELSSQDLEFLLTGLEVSKEDYQNYQWKYNVGVISYFSGIFIMLANIVYAILTKSKELNFIIHFLGAIIGFGGLLIYELREYDLEKSIYKYNKETLIKNMSIEHQNNNIQLNYKFEF
ncbi:MAG: hypothetical protein U0354_07670 [Candidatus Sericytochromatia bacterium]